MPANPGKPENVRAMTARLMPANPAASRLQRVKIVATYHPHRGEIGRFTGKVITFAWVGGSTMAEVQLEHCTHGTDGCFVAKGDVREVDADDQYVR